MEQRWWPVEGPISGLWKIGKYPYATLSTIQPPLPPRTPKPSCRVFYICLSLQRIVRAGAKPPASSINSSSLFLRRRCKGKTLLDVSVLPQPVHECCQSDLAEQNSEIVSTSGLMGLTSGILSLCLELVHRLYENPILNFFPVFLSFFGGGEG